MLINVAAIRLDGGTQVRTRLDKEQIEDFAQMMLTGVPFDDIVVFNDGKDAWLADGFHRVYAALMAGATQIGATVKMGSLEDARLYAFGANTRRGLSLSIQDKINILKQMKEHPVTRSWSNRQIAKHLNCSDVAIGRLKRRMEQKDPIGRIPERPVEPAQTAPEAPQATITASDDQPYVQDPKELVDTINELTSENEKLLDKVALGQYEGSEFEKIDLEERMAEMRTRIAALELEVRTLTESRDYLQNRNAELLSIIKSLKRKLKKETDADHRLDQAA